MFEHFLTPEIVIWGGVLACALAVLTLILAGRFAFVEGLSSRLTEIQTQIKERQKILSDVGQKLALLEELKEKLSHAEKRFAALQREIKPIEEKHLRALSDYEDAKAKLRGTREEWDQLKDKVELYKDRVTHLDTLEQEVKSLAEHRDQLETLVKSLPERQKELESLLKEISGLEKALKTLDDDKNSAQDALKGMRNDIEICSVKLKKRQDEIKEIENNIVDLNAKLKSLSGDRNKLEAFLKSLPERQKELESLLKTIGEKSNEIDQLEKAIKTLDDDKVTAQKALSYTRKELDTCDTELKKRQDEIRGMENARSNIDVEIKNLSEKLKKVGRMPPEAFESLNLPVFGVHGNMVTETDEEKAIHSLHELVEVCGFEIPIRLQDAFHTALKTSDISCLTVMAGVSGTGKSAFPKLYAHAMGIHFLPLAVEPRWDSPHDLFGFLNYMENRFEATTLGRSLVQFNNSPHAPRNTATLREQLMIVLLDEMNLARIEYYFSEFLSKLEMRRNSDISREADYRVVSVEVFPGHADDDKGAFSPPVRLYAGTNILFVGTMNEDESTQSLSDKVIDRANVLYFGRPSKLKDKRQRLYEDSDWLPLPESTWRSWNVNPSSDTIPLYAAIDDLINNINRTLALLGRPFGWRTYRAIQSYIANHPAVRFREDGGLSPLADQVAMRVMPKLRGVDLVEHGAVFNSLGQLIQQLDNLALQQAFDHARQSTQGFFDWRGIDWEY